MNIAAAIEETLAAIDKLEQKIAVGLLERLQNRPAGKGMGI